MQAYKLIKRKPSVIYRWLRLRRHLVHVVTMACVLVVLPLGIASGVHVSRFISANRALAATNPQAAAEWGGLSPSSAFNARAFIGKPGSITALKEADLLSLFKEPDLDRREGGTRIWQYRSASCVLDVYLNEGDRQSAGRVVHYEIRPRQLAAFGAPGKKAAETAVDSSRCLREIAENRA